MYLKLFSVIGIFCLFSEAVESISIEQAVEKLEAEVVQENLMKEKEKHIKDKQYALMMISLTVKHLHQEVRHLCNKGVKYRNNPSAFISKAKELQQDFEQKLNSSDQKGKLFCNPCFCGMPILAKNTAFLMILEVFCKVQNSGETLEDDASTLLKDLEEAILELKELENNFLNYMEKDFSRAKNQQHDAFLDAKKCLWNSICNLPEEIQGDYRRKYFSVP